MKFFQKFILEKYTIFLLLQIILYPFEHFSEGWRLRVSMTEIPSVEIFSMCVLIQNKMFYCLYRIQKSLCWSAMYMLVHKFCMCLSTVSYALQISHIKAMSICVSEYFIENVGNHSHNTFFEQYL